MGAFGKELKLSVSDTSLLFDLDFLFSDVFSVSPVGFS